MFCKCSHRSSDETEHTHRTARLLTTLCAGAGTLHFLKPEPFGRIIPPEIPGEPRNWTYRSGAAELATTARLLVCPRTRRLGGRAIAALFVAVFPVEPRDGSPRDREPK